MAGYFSNHSQSHQTRFTSQQNTPPPPVQHTPSIPTTTAPVTQQARLLSSRHFSTSLANREPDPAVTKTAGSSPSSTTVHPLRNTYVRARVHPPSSCSLVVVNRRPSPAGFSGSASNVLQGTRSPTTKRGSKKSPPSHRCVCRSAFSSCRPRSLLLFLQVESFWSLHTHLSLSSCLTPTTDYLLFHAGVRRPVWEDPLNRAGGKWIIRLRKGVADRVWEDLVCGVVGDMFDECGRGRLKQDGDGNDENGEEWPEICGCTISVRQSEDIVSIWNRFEADMKVREKIR